MFTMFTIDVYNVYDIMHQSNVCHTHFHSNVLIRLRRQSTVYPKAAKRSIPCSPLLLHNAPVKLLCPYSPPGQPRGQRKNVCDEKGRGTRKKGDFSDYIGRGKEKIK